MPARRLPDTDAGRLQALRTAKEKSDSVPAASSPLSAATKTQLDTIYPQFRTEMEQSGVALAGQTAATQAEDTQEMRLRMWSSHFFQNLNMAIDRGVIAASARAFYLLDVSQESLPNMDSETDLVLWSGRAVSGESARVAAGGAAMPFPPATEVNAELTLYNTRRADQSTKKDAFGAEQEDVELLRPTVDLLIRDIWDEVEFAFRHDSASSRRAKAREWGVIYTSRPGEPPQPPAAPTGVALAVGAGNDVTASWIAVTGAGSYRLLKQLVGTDPDFVVVGTTTATTLLVGTFPGGSTVRVKVRALSGTIEGPDSAVVETVIPMPVP